MADYTYKIIEDILVIMDKNLGDKPVTEDIDNVLAEIKAEIKTLPGRIIVQSQRKHYFEITVNQEGAFEDAKLIPARNTPDAIDFINGAEIDKTSASSIAGHLYVEAKKPKSYFGSVYNVTDDEQLLHRATIIAQGYLNDDSYALDKLLTYARKRLYKKNKNPTDNTNKATRRAKKAAVEHLETQTDKRSTAHSTFISVPLEVEKTINTIDKHLSDNMTQTQKMSVARSISALKAKIMKIESLYTRGDYLSQARTLIRQHYKNHSDEIREYIHEATAGSKMADEVATRHRAEYNEKKLIERNNPNYRNKTQTIPYNVAKNIVDQTIETLRSIVEGDTRFSYAKIATSIALLTGRRMFEICKLGRFQETTLPQPYKNNKLGHIHGKKTIYAMKMSGVAKQKNDFDRENKMVTFPVLADTKLIMEGIKLLREGKDFSIYETTKELDKRCGTAFAKALGKDDSYTPIFEHSHIRFNITPKTLRQIYAAIQMYQIRKAWPGESTNFIDLKLAEYLGHRDDDIRTIQSYKDIVVSDTEESDQKEDR